MRHLDLFSGIGGFALAARWAGLETVAFCENDEFCCKVLRKHWPEVAMHGDIRELDGNEYRGIELLTGGFPCQPFSEIGEQQGTEDDRHLWPEMRRVIAQARPSWVVAENVPGIIGMALDDVLADLEAEGYAARPLVVPACGVGANHRRDRVWIVANTSRQPLRVCRQPRKGATVVCLVPARTDTEWWHRYAMKGEIRLLKGRLKFGDATNGAPFPSAVIVFRPRTFQLVAWDARAA